MTTTHYLRAAWRADCPQRAPDLIFLTTDGYRCFRWNEEHIEMLEHRWVTDPGPGRVVHHLNHNRLDNRPENLAPLNGHAEHARQHRHVPDADLLALHQQGLTTIAIGKAVGLHCSQISRRLRAAGVTLGPRSGTRVEVDPEPILRMHDAGHRAPAIARAVGVGTEVVRRVVRESGRHAHKPGRPPARRSA